MSEQDNFYSLGYQVGLKGDSFVQVYDPETEPEKCNAYRLGWGMGHMRWEEQQNSQ